jgi:hypothetical protein
MTHENARAVSAVGIGIGVAVAIAIGRHFDIDSDSEPDTDSDPEIPSEHPTDEAVTGSSRILIVLAHFIAWGSKSRHGSPGFSISSTKYPALSARSWSMPACGLPMFTSA